MSLQHVLASQTLAGESVFSVRGFSAEDISSQLPGLELVGLEVMWVVQHVLWSCWEHPLGFLIRFAISVQSKRDLNPASWIKPGEKIPPTWQPVRDFCLLWDRISLRKKKQNRAGFHSGQFSVHLCLPCLPQHYGSGCWEWQQQPSLHFLPSKGRFWRNVTLV